MHLSQRNRIDGLTKMYREYNVSIGDRVKMELDGSELYLTFIPKSSGVLDDNKELEIQNRIKKETILSVKDKIDKVEYLFFDNEINVRIELIEPILNMLGWSSPELAREEKGRNGKRVDFALYKNKYKAIIEAKSIDEKLSDERLLMQLMDYLYDERFNEVQYGLLTNGREWRAYNREGFLLQSIDLCTTQEKDIIEFFDHFSYDNISQKNTFPKQDTIGFDSSVSSFAIHEKGKIIKEKNATETFKEFVRLHIEEVEELQNNNRFSVTVLATNKNDVRNPSCAVLKDKTVYITGDYCTFFKRMLIKQIINEAELNAWIETND